MSEWAWVVLGYLVTGTAVLVYLVSLLRRFRLAARRTEQE